MGDAVFILARRRRHANNPSVSCFAVKRVAIVQSNYIPWRGYFDLIRSVDEFVLLDDAQYTRRDWRNRNKIKTAQGVKWLTIPVKVKGRYTQRIDETVVSDPSWAVDHWKTLQHAYGSAPHFEEQGAHLKAVYEGIDTDRLSEINRAFIEAVCERLGITTKISWSTDYGPEGTRSDRLIQICGAAGASQYVSGPAARAYLDEKPFDRAGISVSWFEYPEYSEYAQLHSPYEPQVSVVDLLFNVGGRAAQFLGPSRQGTAAGVAANR
jgi:hypothetical protein